MYTQSSGRSVSRLGLEGDGGMDADDDLRGQPPWSSLAAFGSCGQMNVEAYNRGRYMYNRGTYMYERQIRMIAPNLSLGT